MPYMKRSEIIKEYGFDPLEGVPKDSGVTVVPKNREGIGPQEPKTNRPADAGDAAAITVSEDPNASPNEQTGTADPWSNAKAGLLKTFGSDPYALYGLGAGIIDYAINNIGTKEGKTWADSLYQEGGVEKVKGFITQYAQKVKSEHPDWNTDQVRQEIDRWRSTSDEFYDFNAGQMRTGLSYAMRKEKQINNIAGMDKLPTQETTGDTVMQILSGVAIPNPVGVATRLGTSALTRGIGKLATKSIGLLDALVVPGTDIANYGVKTVGAGAAVGIGVDQAIKAATGQPNMLEGNAFQDFQKFPDRQALEVTPGPTSVTDLPIQVPASPEATTVPEAAIGAGAVGLGILGAIAGRRAVRRFMPAIPGERVGAGNVELAPNSVPVQRQAEQFAPNIGMEDVTLRPRGDRIHDAIETGLDFQAGPTQLAREIGGDDLARDVEAITETEIAPSARENYISRHQETGVLPDGSQGHRPRDLFVAAQDAGEDVADQFTRRMLAEEARYMRQQVDDNQLMRSQMALAQHTANPSPRTARALQNELDRTNLLAREAEETRHSFQNMTKADLDAEILRTTNPETDRLRVMLAQRNVDIANSGEASGRLSSTVAQEMRQRPTHTTLFENNKSTLSGWLKNTQTRNDGAFSPSRARDDANFDFDANRLAVNRSIDPFQSYAIRAGNSLSYDKYVLGAKKVLRNLITADPQGSTVRYLGDLRGANPPGGTYAIQLPVNGQMHTWVTTRKNVADAFNAQFLDMGFTLNMLNKTRQVMQQTTTGVASLAAPLVALRSLGYEALTAANFRQNNRSFGLLGTVSRRALGAYQDNPVARAVINVMETIDVVSPTTLVQMGGAFVNSQVWKSYGVAGRAMMDAAIKTHGVWRAIDLVPGGRQMLQNMGQDMWRAMEMTPMGLLYRNDLYNVNSMVSGAFGAGQRYDAIIKQLENGGTGNSTGRALAGSILHGYKSLLGSVADAAKMSFVAQNLANLEAKYGIGRIPANELTRLATEGKNISGNMTAIPQNRIAKGASATLPYAQQTVQSIRYMANAAFTQGGMRSANVAMRLGATVMAVYAGQKMIEASGLNDWFYDQLADHQRVGSIMIPTSRWFQELVQTGDVPQVNPKDAEEYFTAIRIEPVIATFTQAAMTGMEYLGMIKRGKNLSNSNAGSDMQAAASNAIGLGGIPAINAGLALLGQNTGFDLSALTNGQGRGVLTDQPAPRGMGIETGNMPGGTPITYGRTIGALFGLTGVMAVNAYDAGRQADRAGKTFLEAVEIGATELKDEIVSKQPSLGMWDAEKKHYMTPINKRLNEDTANMKGITEQYRMEFGENAGLYPNRPRVRDPEVKKMVYGVYSLLEKGGYLKLEEVAGNLKKKIQALESQKATMSREQRVNTKGELMQKLIRTQDKMATFGERVEGFIDRKLGARLKAEGLDPNLAGFSTLIKKVTR